MCSPRARPRSWQRPHAAETGSRRGHRPPHLDPRSPLLAAQVSEESSHRGHATATTPATADSDQKSEEPQPAGKSNPVRQFIATCSCPIRRSAGSPSPSPAAKRIIHERAIDAVVITVPPFSSVRLATRLRKAFPNLPILVDFRDEWLTTTLHLVSFNSNARARIVAHKAEAEAVRDASSIVLVTEAAKKELQSRYPGVPREMFVTIPNGYDTPPPQPAAASAVANQDRITLTYTAPSTVPPLRARSLKRSGFCPRTFALAFASASSATSRRQPTAGSWNPSATPWNCAASSRKPRPSPPFARPTIFC